MPIFFQQDIDGDTKLAVWKIDEVESFFNVPLQRDITHPHKRLQHLAGRYLLRHLFPAFPLELIKIADTRKPYLDDEAFHFSISHCSDYAAAIVSRNKRVGVDIEVPSAKVERIREKFLHPNELDLFNAQWTTDNLQKAANKDAHLTSDANQNQIHQLTLLWSVKEAVFKWWSYGGVDFSEMIRIQPFQIAESGNIATTLYAPDKAHQLSLQYQLFEEICLAWVTA
ncbi:MAG TPA: 4'-phosphopantetheinyl transferase superfamily protein [Flavisolibacter sp.]|jgi:phosphopantetheinyl transferase|nr:4'-phosphopantetheinyl transferase superfamily protein [Flavisolibacter sp.]